MSQGWLAWSLFTVVPQKGVNNLMEANDRPKQSGGDDENTTKASKADGNTFTIVIYQKMVHFLMSLNSGGTFAHCLCLFFNELEFCVKTARWRVYPLTSLNPVVTLLVISLHAPSVIMQIEVHAPQASLHSTRQLEWRFTSEIFESLDLDFTRP